jgi:transcriptional regulator with XRE-family HTH domain
MARHQEQFMRKYAPADVSSVPAASKVKRAPRKAATVVKKSESGTPELQAISEQLRAAAEKLGLSQNQVAKLSGISRKHVGVAFTGGNISLSVLFKLVRVLKVDSLQAGDVALKAEQKSVNPHLVEHARILAERVANDAHDIFELLREGNFTDHAGRLVRQVASEARRGKARAGRAR